MSLVLQVLVDFCVLLEVLQLIDGVFFILFKQEKLIECGIEMFNVLQIIVGVCDYFIVLLNVMFGWDWFDFFVVLRVCDDRWIWLFVDNLEILLCDELFVFDGFMDELL